MNIRIDVDKTINANNPFLRFVYENDLNWTPWIQRVAGPLKILGPKFGSKNYTYNPLVNVSF